MRFVEIKSQDRLDLQTLHRVRSRLVTARKALLNQLRAILLERGHTFRQGRKVLESELGPFLAELPSELSPRSVMLIEDMCAEWRSLDERIDVLNDDLADHARSDAAALPSLSRHETALGLLARAATWLSSRLRPSAPALPGRASATVSTSSRHGGRA